MNHQIKNAEDADVRISATTRIWKFATVMLALCIPLVVCTSSVGYIATFAAILIPLAVIAAAAFGTAAVWGALGQRQMAAPPSSDLKQLEERMANLEIITRYENALQAEKDLNSQLRAQQNNHDSDEEPRRLAML